MVLWIIKLIIRGCNTYLRGFWQSIEIGVTQMHQGRTAGSRDGESCVWLAATVTINCARRPATRTKRRCGVSTGVHGHAIHIAATEIRALAAVDLARVLGARYMTATCPACKRSCGLRQPLRKVQRLEINLRRAGWCRRPPPGAACAGRAWPGFPGKSSRPPPAPYRQPGR